jgi:hypothetical protein
MNTKSLGGTNIPSKPFIETTTETACKTKSKTKQKPNGQINSNYYKQKQYGTKEMSGADSSNEFSRVERGGE